MKLRLAIIVIVALALPGCYLADYDRSYSIGYGGAKATITLHHRDEPSQVNPPGAPFPLTPSSAP